MSGRERVRGTLLGALLLATPGLGEPLAAQDTSTVRLEITLTPDTAAAGGRSPIVRTLNLLGDTPWLAALRQGLPVRLRYRVEVWRSRDAWLDALQRQFEWNLVVQHEPLLDQFTVTQVLGRQRIDRRVGTAGALAEVLGRGYDVRVAPTAPGQYYYVASLEVNTLSESDLDELERILRGGLPGSADTARGGTILGRGARRLLLRLAGLPTLKLAARSESFAVR